MSIEQPKWDEYKKVAMMAADKMECDTILVRLADSCMEVSQWAIRKATGEGFKKPNSIELLNNLACMTAYSMVLHDKMACHQDLFHTMLKEAFIDIHEECK